MNGGKIGDETCLFTWFLSTRICGTGARYGRTRLYLRPTKFCEIFHILGAISSYELRFGCSSARWTRMDEGYNTIALDLDFDLM
jgi:hypothetical protein